MTRCRVGDLIVIVGSDFPANIGRYGTVVGKASDPEEWSVRPQNKMWGWDENKKAVEDNEDLDAYDRDLRPIRDPGDSAIDETIQRLGTPAQKAMAELESELAKLREIARELKELSKVLER